MSARTLTATLAASFCLLALAPSALAAAPAIKLTASSQPTNFVPGAVPQQKKPGEYFSKSRPQYSFIATNVGSAPTSGPIVFTDTLPEGLTPVAPGARDFLNAIFQNLKISCGVSLQTVTCTDPEPLQPGQWAQFLVPVEVASDAGPTVLNEGSVSGGGAAEARTAIPTTIGEALPSFDFLPGANGFSFAATAQDGSAATQAGSHPGQLGVDLDFPSAETEGSGEESGGLYSTGHVRDLKATLPRGVLGNPSAIPVRCTEAQLESDLTNGGCPVASQVGLATPLTDPTVGATPYPSALYLMAPPPGVAAELAFDAIQLGIYIHLPARVNSAGEYEIVSDTKDLLARELNPILGAQVQLWGNPSGTSHDAMRGDCSVIEITVGCEVATERTEDPFLTMPASCRASLTAMASANSWEEPTQFHNRSASFEDSLGASTPTVGCEQLEFEPSIESKPTTDLAESPSGLDFNLHQRQNSELEDLATAPVKDVTVALPEGMTLNPAAAQGLAGCGSAQIGLSTAIGASPIRFDEAPPACPVASRLGTLEVTTPLLAKYDEEEKLQLDPEGKPVPDSLHGSVYLAQPFDNPFDSLLAIYLTVEDPKTGTVAKLPGKVSADPKTGQLVTRFTESPELPLEDVSVHLFGGPRGPLITPPLCGNHTTTTTLTPWSAPEGQDAHPSDSFATSAFPGGGACPTAAGQAPNSPSFDAGTIAPLAGAYSPFVLKLSRSDGSQRLTGIDTTLPPGLIGKLAGLTRCSEAQLAAAKAREEASGQGAAEQQGPSCPASSEVGTVDVSAGAGPLPLHVGGRAYLAGPYKGAPLSLAVITPAVAGPFDLGAVVLRVALNLDPQKAQIHAVSDAFPTVLEGIPLDIRGAALKMGRPEFTLNPTSCDPMAIDAIASTTTGAFAPLRSPFQVGGCPALGFKPKLSFRLKGGTKRGGHPALLATYGPRPGDANLKGLVVRLPHSAFLDQAHIRTICTRVQFAAKACPKGAQYGFIKAFTPLLDEPLEGPVYLRSSSHKLPDLVFDLHGIVDVEVASRIDSVRGGIRASIESAPDAPISKVLLRMQGAKKGLIVNSRNLCEVASKASVDFSGHNGKQSSANPVMRADCKKRRKR
jgi:hypothetical protein